ncbi:MAG: aminotransferase class III-fold pyridoxal phosphate-dependent enzyme [Flavobacteriaceae bacterium]|nr:aminotransferase class III-fold pyridoxal phosphate-dependent enzyme [Flavobacteriaceae bacterium]MDG2315175.1 aminotransferase class III-fold pyridoxal phosphate-dependent enzyme [Flavobacteriaceae bacterium]
MPLFDVYPLYDVTPVRAKGVHVYDTNDQEYLDLYGGHAVISIGHNHPEYSKRIKNQLDKIGFYSNAIQNPLQVELANLLESQSQCLGYQLFLCSSGAEANENALKLASFYTGKKRVIAFKNAFHGRTSAAVASTDNQKINAPLNAQQEVTFLPFNDAKELENELAKGDVCAVIFESIQGVGGLDEPSEEFVYQMEALCKQYKSCLIADEVQAGFGRTGTFFGFQKYNIEPHIISMAKGMGNGFPVGGILIHPSIEAQYGMLGTTFGGNHLACAATLSVLETLEKENLQHNAAQMGVYFKEQAQQLPRIQKIKGRGLMLGIEFDFEVGELRKKLIYDHRIFTGGSSNKKLLRILPPLSIEKKHIDSLINALKTLLE